MIVVQYRGRDGQWVDAPSAPKFNDEQVDRAADWCRDVYAAMDPITWVYAPDMRVWWQPARSTGFAVVEFYAVRQTPRVYA